MSSDLTRVFVASAEDGVQLPQHSPIQAAEFERLVTAALTSFTDDRATTCSTPASSISEGYASATSSIYRDLQDTSSPPSSPESSTQQSEKSQIQLPDPFYPPSIIQLEGDVELKPRSIPADLCLPPVPQEAANGAIDPQDKGTPDSWIPRDPRLVRLTGKHPFNCEAKLKDLYAEGFLTPSNLFYVRNHGAVPKVDKGMAESWELKIHGVCANPVTLTLADLHSKFQVVTVPITLVCAGNRRKEQNVVQKSLGFSWGAAGLSTALFTGVYLSDVLEYIKPTKAAKHVIFEGSDELPNGPYGTSQRLTWARDKRKGMMLSWAMNGLALEPDHGYPLRLVVPAQIGGRSVKWLNRIELSESESQHHLHFHDNKVLPMTVGPDQARAEKHWWYDPRYIINDLNVNSAIACPDHDEILDTNTSEQVYIVRGYAYAGGGRRVTRVEISFDDGSTWSLANIIYPEDLFRTVVHSDPIYGTLDLTDSDTCFCWCFWSFEASLQLLSTSAAIMVRCMDESMALQPSRMYWNPTGMMNNWWFRVVIHKEQGDKLRFEHPTMAGTQPGGWMQRLKDQGMDPSKPVFLSDLSSEGIKAFKMPFSEVRMTKPGVDRKITAEELATHKQGDEPWFAVKGEVYNGAGFLKDHPGGSQSITLVGGEDATEDFMAIHSSDAKKQLADFHIGTLVGNSMPKTDGMEDRGTGHFLNRTRWKKIELVSIQTISTDSKIFRFALQRPDQELGLPVGQHVYVRLRRKITGQEKGEIVEGELVQRAYTPISMQNDIGFIDMLIKIYYPSSQFPLGGRMTLGFSELAVGDFVELKGPIGHFIWKGAGIALLHGKERRVREMGMVCGGSGVTPILQVLRGILHDISHRDTKVWVLDVNRYFDDILCREELHQLFRDNKERFQLHHTLTGNNVPEDWEYSTGRPDNEMFKTHLPVPAEDSMVCICGPSAMEQATKAALEGIGWNLSSLVIF